MMLLFALLWYVFFPVLQTTGQPDQALSLTVCGMSSLTIHYVGLHLAGDYPTKAEAIHDVVMALKWSSIAAPIGIISGLCTRLSICLFLLRIFGRRESGDGACMLLWGLPQLASSLRLSLFWPSVRQFRSSGTRACQEVAGQLRLLLR